MINNWKNTNFNFKTNTNSQLTAVVINRPFCQIKLLIVI